MDSAQPPEDPRDRLSRLMEDRRLELRERWTDVAERGGVTAETIREVRRATSPMRPLTKRGIEAGLRWTAGSIDAILAGGDPTPEAGVMERLAAIPDAAVAEVLRRPDISDEDKQRLVELLLDARRADEDRRVELAKQLIEVWQRNQAN